MLRAPSTRAAAPCAEGADECTRKKRGRVAWQQGNRERAEQLPGEAHALGARSANSDSVSSAGDTTSGGALTAKGGARLAPVLDRWRSLAERDVDVDIDAEYRAH